VPPGVVGLARCVLFEHIRCFDVFSSLEQASPSAYETVPLILAAVPLSDLSATGVGKETGITFAERCDSLLSVCDVLSLVHPTAAIAAASRVAVIFPLRVMWPPRVVGRFIAVDHLKVINASDPPNRGGVEDRTLMG
jgi:hypothetical protein